MAWPIAAIQFLAWLMWACRTKSIFQFRTAHSALRTVYMPHANLVSFVFVKLFCWGVPGRSSSVQFCPGGSVAWVPASSGLMPLLFQLVLMWSFVTSIMLLMVICWQFRIVCVIAGVRFVNLGCSPMNLSGGNFDVYTLSSESMYYILYLTCWMKIAFIITRKRNNVVVSFGTLKVQSFMLTKVKDCDLLIVVTSSTFLKRKDIPKEKRQLAQIIKARRPAYT